MLNNDPLLKRDINRIARKLATHESRLSAMERTAQGRFTSVSGGATTYYDNEGNVILVVGSQTDGTGTVVHQNGTVPAVPSLPIVTSGVESVEVTWDGKDYNGFSAWLDDFSHVEVHVSFDNPFTADDSTQRASFHSRLGGSVTIVVSALVPVYVALVAVNKAGGESAQTASVLAEATVVTNPDLELLQTETIPYLIAELGAIDERFPVEYHNISANAVRADKLTVGSLTDSLIPNGNFEDWDAEFTKPILWAQGTTGTNTGAIYGKATGADIISGTGSVTIEADTGGTATLTNEQMIPVTPSAGVRKYYIGASMRSPSSTASALEVGVNFYDADGAPSVLDPSESTVWNSITGLAPYYHIATVPNDAAFMEVFVRALSPIAGSTVVVDDVEVRRLIGGAFISEASILSANIADAAITTAKIQDASITNAKIVSLDATKITTGFLNANRIQAGSIFADKLTFSSVTSGTNRNGNMEDELIVAEVGQGRPANWLSVWSDPAAPALSYETTTPLSGAKSLKVTRTAGAGAQGIRIFYIDETYGWANFTNPNAWLPTSPGDVWNVSAKIRPNFTIPAGTADVTMHISNSLSGGLSPVAIFDDDAQWHTAVYTPAIASGETATIAGSFKVPAAAFGTNNLPARYMSISVKFQTAAIGDIVVVDDLVVRPAVTDSSAYDISASKIITGLLQASQRIVAGVSLTGARAEMNPAGFQAFNSSNTETFQVLASSGDAIIGGATAFPRIKMSVAANAAESGQNWALHQFYVASGWDPGQSWGSSVTDGEGTWGTLRLAAPYVTGQSYLTPAYIDMRTRSDGLSRTIIRAQQMQFSADTFQLTSTAGSVDFNMTNSQVFQILRPGGDKLDINFDGADFCTVIRARVAAGTPRNMRLTARDIFVNPQNTAEMVFNSQGSQGNAPIFGCATKDTALVFNHDTGFNPNVHLQVANYNGTANKRIQATAFDATSDIRAKSKLEPVTGALVAIKAMKVQDYDTDSRIVGAKLPRGVKATKLEKSRGRGLIAQELKEIVPEVVNGTEDFGYSVDIYALLATSIAAVQELANEVTELKDKINK